MHNLVVCKSWKKKNNFDGGNYKIPLEEKYFHSRFFLPWGAKK